MPFIRGYYGNQPMFKFIEEDIEAIDRKIQCFKDNLKSRKNYKIAACDLKIDTSDKVLW